MLSPVKSSPVDWLESTDILNAFPTGVVISDDQGNVVFCNSELETLFGYHQDELIDQPVDILLPEHLRSKHPQHIKSYMDNPTKREMGSSRELFGLHKSGSTFPIEIALNPIETAHGRHIIATVEDISKRKVVEDNFKSVFESAPVGMIMVDENAQITQVNQHMLNIFGYKIDELANKPLESLLPERHRQQHPAYQQAYLKNPTTRSMGLESELTGLHKSGSEIPVEIGLNPMLSQSGNITIATVSDITERKKAENRLKQLNADLDEFTYVASHDLKSPLRGISSLIEWIEEDLGEDIIGDVKNNLERAHLRINRMEKLIEDLLAFARSGRHQGSVCKVSVKQVLNNTIELLDVPNGFKISMNGYLGDIHSAITPLETVLRNLISNAIKHHDKDQGNININTEIEGAYCIFEIKDDGPGIPENAQERIFKLFQSLDNSSTSNSGVGLAVTKRLVEAGNGRIEVKSTTDTRGTSFKFWWPRFSRSDINEH